MNKNPTQKEEEKTLKNAFIEVAEQYPEIYDYYIKMKENSKDQIIGITDKEINEQILKFVRNVKFLISRIEENSNIFNNSSNSFEEAKKRIEWFKDVIENQDVYKVFYDERTGDQIIKYENDLQRMFKLAWMQSVFKINAESNNGRGPADFVVSYGESDVCIVEFKMAENKKLKQIFQQIEIYKKANRTSNHIAVIFYFNDSEYERVIKILKDLNKEEEINNTFYLIDCRQKVSASNVSYNSD